MNILVCIKQVPDSSDVEVDEKTGVLKREGVDSKMNPFDLYALETAVMIKESHSANVSVLTMGPLQALDIIKEAFMMGADSGAMVSDKKFAGADVLATSYTLSQGIEKVGIPELIICGMQTTDGDTAQVGPEIAEFLNIPHIAYVTKIVEIKSKTIILEMELENSISVLEVEYPCLITVEKNICQPRLPSFRLKQKSNSWEIPIYSLDDFKDHDEDHYGLNGSPTQVKRIFPPERNIDHELWNGSSDEVTTKLTDKLRELKFI